MKLAAAGFSVTEDAQSPHNLVLTVDYREERGKPISINLSGTEINCRIHVDHSRLGQVMSIQIRESPAYAEMVSAPYIEVVEKFQTNPYFYFLGDLIRGWSDARLDTTGALIQALNQQLNREQSASPVTPDDTLLSPAETFPDLDLHFASWAQENAVEELGRLKDPRAVALLERLMFHSDRKMRLRAVLALGQFDSLALSPVLTQVAHADTDAGVRDAAAAVLTKFSTP
jgi:hypothetical protein